MMTLIFLLITVAMLALMLDKDRVSTAAFTSALAISLYWFAHHATSSLNLVL